MSVPRSLWFLFLMWSLSMFGVGSLTGCTGDDDTQTGDDDTQTGDDDTQTGDDDTQAGDDDTQAGDDDTQAGDDDTQAGDDDTQAGDDDTQAGDDDTQAGDDDTQAGDDDTQAGDDDTQAGDDDTQTGDDDTSVTDQDGDGVLDDVDNCPAVSNDLQEDVDTDGIGDACDACPDDADNDLDGDGVCGNTDNCPAIANDTQDDADSDGSGDVCDACPNDSANDVDGDGVCGDVDSCPAVANGGQEDTDSDGLGDACDTCINDADNDVDGDGVCGDTDSCPAIANEAQEDTDADGIGDACDACPDDADNDIDGDGVCGDVDNCPGTANADQEDADNDGLGDTCDTCPNDADNDADGDGLCGDVDTCPNDADNDADGDGLCRDADACPNDADNDVDGDTICGDVDACPNDADNDADGDGICGDVDTCPNDADNDADGDGICGDVDTCPNDADNDADGDGICGDVDTCPNDADNDADGDGLCGDVDTCPNDADNDADGDGICGDVDTCPNDANNDVDGDGICGDVDTCPNDADNDADSDGICGDVDNCVDVINSDQADSDGDGAGDLCDVCPLYEVVDARECPDLIYDIKEGYLVDGDPTWLYNVLVTAVNQYGFFLQVREDDIGYYGPEYSGIWVYDSTHDVFPGDRLELAATVNEWYGQIQIEKPTYVLLSEGDASPDPTVLISTELALDDQGQNDYAFMFEGVVIEIQDTIVTDIAPPAGPGDYADPNYEFEVDSALRVDDYLFQIEPFPELGTEYFYVAGILAFQNNYYKLLPRDVDDYGYPNPPVLIHLSPEEQDLGLGASTTFDVIIDQLAPTGGLTINLSVDPVDAGSLPVTLTIPEGAYFETFTYTDSGNATDAIITAEYDGNALYAFIYGVQPVVDHLVINEVDYDQPNTDSNEFVEIYNPTDAQVPLTGLAVVLINGKDGSEYGRYALDTVHAALDPGEFLVVASETVSVPDGTKVVLMDGATNNVQNGAPDGVALIHTGTLAVIDALSYEGDLTVANIDDGAGGTVERNLVEGTATSVQDGNTNDGSLCRLPNGWDTDDASVDWSWCDVPTAGTANQETTL